MLSAAKPWTYWMALPLVVSAVVALLAFAGVYLKKVVEPDVLRRDALAAAKTSRSLRGGGNRSALPAS